MNILLIDNKTSHLPHLESLLTKFGQVKVISSKYDFNEDDYNLVVLSGGHHTYITEHPEDYQKEIELVKKTNKPVLGVCLGAEIVSYAFGAKLSTLPDKQKGLVNVEVVNADGIFGETKIFTAYENHKIAIETLSEELHGLAKSETGYEVIKHKTKSIYGFQFHPEIFQDIAYGDEIFINTLNLLKKVD